MNISHEDALALGLAHSYAVFKESLAGQDLLEHLRILVDGSMRAIDECADYREATALVIRRQQRKVIVDAIIARIENHIELKDSIMELMKQPREEEQLSYGDTPGNTD